MTEQYEVIEVQNKSRLTYVFDVSDYQTNGRTWEQAEKACESAAKAKYHTILVAAYGSNEPYCGAVILHYINDVVVLDDGNSEIIQREVSA